jgi:small-conductance mechanosensitive channel
MDTSLEQLKEIPEIIKSIINSTKDTALDRVHFLTYGDYSLKYEVVYIVLTADFNRYADIQQEINLRIFESFQQKGIKFALPSQTILMTSGKPQLRYAKAYHPFRAHASPEFIQRNAAKKCTCEIRLYRQRSDSQGILFIQ